MQRDPLRGNLFENMIIAEFMKQRFNEAKSSNLYFFRDSNGNEVDLLAVFGDGIFAIEIKSGQTVADDYFKGIRYIDGVAGDKIIGRAVVYGGPKRQERSDIPVYPYRSCGEIHKKFLTAQLSLVSGI